mmetsp:Transcript_61216/g.173868  ORF Transcript_61216/g.173868 Transcript_61216/m.173868 type:complete len:251 (-) Transcript_61216:508-1260(-)
MAQSCASPPDPKPCYCSSRTAVLWARRVPQALSQAGQRYRRTLRHWHSCQRCQCCCAAPVKVAALVSPPKRWPLVLTGCRRRRWRSPWPARQTKAGTRAGPRRAKGGRATLAHLPPAPSLRGCRRVLTGNGAGWPLPPRRPGPGCCRPGRLGPKTRTLQRVRQHRQQAEAAAARRPCLHPVGSPGGQHRTLGPLRLALPRPPRRPRHGEPHAKERCWLKLLHGRRNHPWRRETNPQDLLLLLSWTCRHAL